MGGINFHKTAVGQWLERAQSCPSGMNRDSPLLLQCGKTASGRQQADCDPSASSDDFMLYRTGGISEIALRRRAS